MNTIKTQQAANDDSNNRGFLWGAFSWFAVAAMLLLSLGAGVSDDGIAQTEAAAASTVVARSDADRAWNEHEDLKAGSYVGQPGIY